MRDEGIGPRAADGIDARDAIRARTRQRAVRISVVSAVVLLLLLGYLVVERKQFDDSEWYSNTELNPQVQYAYPVGNNMTAVMYYKVDRLLFQHPSDNDFYVSFLDAHGQLTGPEVRLPDVWYLGPTSEQDSMFAAGYGTASRITVLCRPIPYYLQSSRALRCIGVDALTGEVSQWTEPVPGLNLSGHEFRSAQWDSDIHVLVWRLHSGTPVNNGSVVYARSTDEGRSWQDPIALLDGNVTMEGAFLSVREDIVSVLLLDVNDPARGWNGSVDLLVQSMDAGASFGAPVGIAGDMVSQPTYGHAIAQGPDGSILLLTRATTGEGTSCELSTIDTNGTVASHVPPVSPTRPLELIEDTGHPGSYRADVYGVRYYDWSEQITRLDVYSVGGVLTGSTTTSLSRHHPSHNVIYTRAGDGYREGITTRTVSTAHGDLASQATEILIVRVDNGTEEVRTVGKPYEVVFMHTEAEREAYAGRTSPVLSAAWVTTLVLLIAGLLATKLSTRVPDRAEMVSWVKLLLLAMVVLLPACMAVGLYVDEHDLYWHPHPNLYGLAFVVAGVCMVEMRARISQKVPPPRMLHVPFAVLGVLLVSFYPGVGFIASEWSVVLLIGLTMLVWPVLLFLSVSIPFRFHAQMAPGEERCFHIALSISLLTVASISLFFPLFMFIGSFHGIP